MPVQLNHTIVWCLDQKASARFLTEILGLPPAHRHGPFQAVALANNVTLDFGKAQAPVQWQHYAFQISAAEFDAAFQRIQGRGLPYWADPQMRQPGEIYRYGKGRGLYFRDPDGHLLEILTER